MEDLTQYDVAIYGPSGGPSVYAEAEGRFNGGGWIREPLAFSDFDGKGIWAQPPEADGEKNLTTVPQGTQASGGNMGPYGGMLIWDAVERSAGSPTAEGGWF
jgi:hypothetical protein